MKPDKKPRADSILDSQLNEGQKEELRCMLMSGFSQAQCKAWLSQSCSVTVKSGDTLTTFWKRHCAPLVSENRKLSAVKAENYVDAAKRTYWDSATTELMKQTTFEILSGQSLDPKTADVFVKNLLKIRAQEMDERRLKLIEQKAAQADKASEITNDAALTEEEKAARIKQLFRMG